MLDQFPLTGIFICLLAKVRENYEETHQKFVSVQISRVYVAPLDLA